MIPNIDIVVQLGSQVKFVNGYQLAIHTKMRTEATAFLLSERFAKKAIILGGSNFGIRYNYTEILNSPDFSFEAFAGAHYEGDAESIVIKEYLVNIWSIPYYDIFAETLSATTEENAEFLKILLRRRPMFTGKEKIGLLTLLYHMERALPVFKKAGLDVIPIFAEEVLFEQSSSFNLNEILNYYKTPKGGKQYPVEEIKRLLTQGKSLIELMGK